MSAGSVNRPSLSVSPALPVWLDRDHARVSSFDPKTPEVVYAIVLDQFGEWVCSCASYHYGSLKRAAFECKHILLALPTRPDLHASRTQLCAGCGLHPVFDGMRLCESCARKEPTLAHLTLTSTPLAETIAQAEDSAWFTCTDCGARVVYRDEDEWNYFGRCASCEARVRHVTVAA